MMKLLQRKTKVIWSLSSSRLEEALVADLQAKDIGALTLLYAPSSHAETLAFLEKQYAHTIKFKQQKEVPLLLDFCSHPAVTILSLIDPLAVKIGEELRLVSCTPSVAGEIQVECKDWDMFFCAGGYIHLGSSSVVLSVIEVDKKGLAKVRVVHEGIVRAGEQLHNLDFFAAHQAKFLSALSTLPLQAVDYLVLPASLEVSEIQSIQQQMEKYGDQAPWILLRFASPDSFHTLEVCLPWVKGVVISRLHLALTGNASSVPILTKRVTQLCNEQAKIVILASEMLASMKDKPTPTRAEVSDVANAVIDGVDAVTLAEELIAGAYEDRALQVCNNIIEDLEDHTEIGINWRKRGLPILNVLDAVSFHSFQTALRVGAKAIVCITQQGNTALRLASFRPQIPIVAVTFSLSTKRKLSLIRGVIAVALEGSPNLDTVLPSVQMLLKQDQWFASGDKIVFVSVSISSMGTESSNLFTVQEIE